MAEKDQEKKIAGGEVAPCSCHHAFQDQEYGKGRRYHVRIRGGKKCTVCGRTS